MVIGMANRVTSEIGGEGVAVCPEGLISWVLTPVLGERGVMVKGECHFSSMTRAHFCRAVIMWGGSIGVYDILFFGLHVWK